MKAQRIITGLTIVLLIALLAVTARVYNIVDMIQKDYSALRKDVAALREATVEATKDIARNAESLAASQQFISAVLDSQEEAPIQAELHEQILEILKYVESLDGAIWYNDKEKSPESFVLQLRAKYLTIQNTITSVEDFIDRVCAKTVVGNEYYYSENGEKVELPKMLKEKFGKGDGDAVPAVAGKW